jgi:AGZA family xanthine/uracil permease-like MFS transporter
MAEMIDRRLARSALYLGILAVFTFFGIVHSALPEGNMYLPWRLPHPLQRAVAHEVALGYLVIAALFLALSRSRESREPAPEGLGH